MTTTLDTPATTHPAWKGPGIYSAAELSLEQYHRDVVPGGSLSSSGARALLNPGCPAQFKYDRDHPKPPKAEFEIGTAVHTEVLGSGPANVVTEYDSWRTKAAQTDRDRIRAGRGIPLLAHEGEQVAAMAQAIRQHPIAGPLLTPGTGTPEQSLYWADAEEMQHLSSENETLRKAVTFLMIESIGKTSIDLWNDDLDHWNGSLDFESSPDRENTTRFTFIPSGRAKDGVSAADAAATNTTLRDLLAAHIAAALTSGTRNRWTAGRDLAQGLDAAGANVDRLIDRHITAAGHNPKTAWEGPTASADDPWTPIPDVTGDVPEVVRSILAGCLTDMLLNPGIDDVRQWARSIAHALSGAGADITPDIRTRILAATLDAPSADVPF